MMLHVQSPNTLIHYGLFLGGTRDNSVENFEIPDFIKRPHVSISEFQSPNEQRIIFLLFIQRGRVEIGEVKSGVSNNYKSLYRSELVYFYRFGK